MALLPPKIPEDLAHLSFEEILGKDSLDGEPAQWEQRYRDLFHPKFSITLTETLADASDMEQHARRLAINCTPGEKLLAINGLMKPLIGEPPDATPLNFHFYFLYSSFRDRFPIRGLHVLAYEPVSIWFLNLDEEKSWRTRSQKCPPDGRLTIDNILLKLGRHRHAQTGSSKYFYYNPFIITASIAIAQRLALYEYYGSTTTSLTCSCRHYHSYIVAATNEDCENLHVYTTSISSAILELVNFPNRRPARCNNNACYDINGQFTPIAYEPHEFLSLRLRNFGFKKIEDDKQQTAVQQQRPPPMGDAAHVMRDWWMDNERPPPSESSKSCPQSSGSPSTKGQVVKNVFRKLLRNKGSN
ncbi:hypothetical protein F4680DRAFT_7725 [Xylaria scruposa]|nr:hypothetical protein F4680DRAFT_7725 [Xylaria scruposa]